MKLLSFLIISISFFLSSCSQLIYVEKADKGFVASSNPTAKIFNQNKIVFKQYTQTKHKKGDTIALCGYIKNKKDTSGNYVYLVESAKNKMHAFNSDDIIRLEDHIIALNPPKLDSNKIDSLIKSGSKPINKSDTAFPHHIALWVLLGSAAQTDGGLSYQGIGFSLSALGGEFFRKSYKTQEGSSLLEYWLISLHFPLPFNPNVSLFAGMGRYSWNVKLFNESLGTSDFAYGAGSHIRFGKIPILIGISWNSVSKLNLNIGLSFSLG